MTVTFEPKAISEVECLCLIIDYVLTDETSMRTLADDYEISKTCVWKYLQNAHVYDNKLDGLVRRKCTTRYCGCNLPKDERKNPPKRKPYKLRLALYNHLLTKYDELCNMTELPPDLGKFLWDGYTKSSK